MTCSLWFSAVVQGQAAQWELKIHGIGLFEEASMGNMGLITGTGAL